MEWVVPFRYTAIVHFLKVWKNSVTLEIFTFNSLLQNTFIPISEGPSLMMNSILILWSFAVSKYKYFGIQFAVFLSSTLNWFEKIFMHTTAQQNVLFIWPRSPFKNPFPCLSFVKMVFPEFHHHFVRSKFLFGRGGKATKSVYTPISWPDKGVASIICGQRNSKIFFMDSQEQGTFFFHSLDSSIHRSILIAHSYARKANLALAMNQQQPQIFITIFCLLLFRRPCIHTSLFFPFGSGYFCVIDWPVVRPNTHTSNPTLQ